MKIEVSNGEILDKYGILILKKLFITDEEKLKNVQSELDSLATIVVGLRHKYDLFKLEMELFGVNRKLWVIEDQIRKLEREQRFDDEFIELARSVYKNNDERAKLKRQINELTESELTEEKSYEGYSDHSTV